MGDVTRDMEIRKWESENKEGGSVRAVVFVHGIFSDHTRFNKCLQRLKGRLNGWGFYYVDYDYHDSLDTNGKKLVSALCKKFSECDEVVVVAHSMGGLVARIACLREQLRFVRKVFLLATPNHGALRTSSLGIQAQMVRAATGVLWGIRPWKPGMRDLTRVGDVMRKPLESAGNNSDHIDYVTIPGRYFHRQRGVFDHHSDERWKVLFIALGTLVDGLEPLLSVKLERPHDGIVEEASNCLIPDEAERPSEKRYSIRRVDQRDGRVSYAHVVPDSAIDLCHVMVPDDGEVIDVMASIINACTLAKWLGSDRSNHDAVNVRLFNYG